jgi:thiamine-phosphate pyrophosphorylase
LITDRRRTRGRDLGDVVVQAVWGGVGMVQIRERDLPDDEILALIESWKRRLPATTRLVVNDRPDLARRAAVGLHLPAASPPADPRPEGPLGRSVHDLDETDRALADRPDYLIAGTIYATASKPARPPAGPDLIRRVHARAAGVPIYAIGGITVSRIPEVVHAGAHGVAVCGAILSDSDPRRVAQAMDLALRVVTLPPL